MDADSPAALSVDQAAGLLIDGGLVAFPTETVYGLGADAANRLAVDAIFALKGRPPGHPLIVHLAVGADPAAYFADSVPELAYRLIERFWPGPLTLVLHRQAGHAAAAAGRQSTIGLRCPSHLMARQLLAAVALLKSDTGLAAPSANRFGHVSPTSAAHVRAEFGSSLAVLDGGACPVGIESTIVDLSRLDRVGAVLLRPGSITREMLAEVIGSLPKDPDLAAPRVSGNLASHYAPLKPLRLVAAGELSTLSGDVAVWAFAAEPVGSARTAPWLLAPATADAYASHLYRVLRELDASTAVSIAIERPPTGALWEAINDRLERAATNS